MKRLLFLLFLLGVAIASLGAETAPAKAPPLESAEAIVARHVAALGGREALARITTLRLAGRSEGSGETSPLTITRRRPDRVRIDFTVEGQPVVLAWDGRVAWQSGIGEHGSGPEPMPEENAARFVEEWAAFDGGLAAAAAAGHAIEVVGREELDGAATVRLKVTLPSGRMHDWWLDERTALPVRRVTPLRHPRRGELPRVWYYLEHRPLAGLVLPSYLEREDSQMIRAYAIEKAEANVELPEGFFSLPAPQRSAVAR